MVRHVIKNVIMNIELGSTLIPVFKGIIMSLFWVHALARPESIML